MTDGNSEVIIGTTKGQAIRFEEGKVRSMGRTAIVVVTLQEMMITWWELSPLPKKIGPQEPCLFYLRMATVSELLLMILKQEILSIGELIEEVRESEQCR